MHLTHDIDDWGPEKVIVVSDRRSGMRGVLVIDNTARGSGKGGTRMSPTLTIGEVARLARTMTWKWAAVDLFHGGAKAGILGDPNDPGKEHILRAFARALAGEVPAEYAFGLDLGISEADAAIFADELGGRSASTGLPAVMGGFPYDQYGTTGFGVAEAVDAAVPFAGLALSGTRVTIQGFGAVGHAVAARLAEQGAMVVGISAQDGGVVEPDGLDIERLLALREEFGDGGILRYGQTVSPEEVIDAGSDILIPCAREDTIDASVARTTSARVIVEGANLPTNPQSRAVLHERGIIVVPDFIANAGGIIAAAHSSAARNSPFAPVREDVHLMVAERIRSNTLAVLDRSTRTGVPAHRAAQELAQHRVAAAMRLRGFMPHQERNTP